MTADLIPRTHRTLLTPQDRAEINAAARRRLSECERNGEWT